MDSFWELLELEPTQDVSAIKRAYAQKARICHPEDDPEGFLKLREAYQAALDYAEGRDTSAPPEMDWQEDSEDSSDEPPVQSETEEEEPGWTLQENLSGSLPNPYEDSEAIRTFLELYTGKQRKNPKLWLDYFTSAAFLDAGWDSQFTAMLLEKVNELEEMYPPNREFLTWLSIAYQLSGEPGTREFDGVDDIRCIVTKGPAPKRPKGNEFAILQSFQDYRHLVRLAEAGRWDQEVIDEYRNVMNRYSQSYIRERCEQRVTPDCERHPAGLRVFIHFFQRDDLPETVYLDAWRRLGLKTAIMGRAKALYGPLRERVLERVPNITDEAPENFLQLTRNLDAYLKRIKNNLAEEEEASAAFFASEEMQKALPSPRFVESQLLCYSPWRRDGMGEGLVRRLLAFYREHSGIRRSAEAAAGLEGDLKRLTMKRWSREDAKAALLLDALSLAYRPFFRHWLNTGFYTARDPESGTPLLEYLENSLPYQKEWSRRFAKEPVTVAMGNVEVDFYPLHMELRVDGEPVYCPCLPWEQTAGVECNDQFFFLLPITVAPYDAFSDVVQVILDRLSSTAAPEADRAVIARYLAGHICRLTPDNVLPMELCAEGGGRLHVCVWQENGEPISLCQQTISGRRMQRTYQLEPGETYLEAARHLLAEAVSPTRFDLSRLRVLPRNIYFTPNNNEEVHLIHPDLLEINDEEQMPLIEQMTTLVTDEALSSLLACFNCDELERLEMEWPQGRLVLCRDGEKYACLYFENHFGRGDYWYALLADPEMYRTVDGGDVKKIPFGMGKLWEYSIFDSAAALMGNMGEVLAQMGWGQLQSGGPGGWLWSCDVNMHDSKHKLLMAQQKMGGIPPCRGRNEYLMAKFVFSRYPVRIGESADPMEEQDIIDLQPGGFGRAAADLLQFVQGKLARLRLTWAFKTQDGGVYHRHMVLIQYKGRFMMLWLQDDKQRADAYAADDPVLFLGYIAPACLVHQNVARIRNCVDLLLDDIDNTEPVVDRPGEFVPISMPYQEIRAKLVKEA